VASYRTVLVGTDGSESSFRAVDKAAAVAADSGGRLLLLCAFQKMDKREQQRAEEELGHDAYKVTGSAPAESVLGDAEDRAKKAGARDIERKAVHGEPVDVLLQLAATESVDLVVVGNRGLNSLAGRLLGSVPATISHQARCDVLIVHTTGR